MLHANHGLEIKNRQITCGVPSVQNANCRNMGNVGARKQFGSKKDFSPEVVTVFEQPDSRCACRTDPKRKCEVG